MAIGEAADPGISDPFGLDSPDAPPPISRKRSSCRTDGVAVGVGKGEKNVAEVASGDMNGDVSAMEEAHRTGAWTKIEMATAKASMRKATVL
jgi:hypothetical protein